MRTYKYRLHPNRIQAERIDWTIERCRLLYNRLLEERKTDYKQHGKSMTRGQQSSTLPARKEVTPELKEIYAQVLVDVVDRVDRAYKAFFQRLKSGAKPGFPHFKDPKRYDSFTFPQQGHGFSITTDGRHLHLSKIGDIRIKLHRKPEGTIKQCIVTRQNGKYYACLTCDTAACLMPPSNACVGVDVGLQHLIATSDGDTCEALQAYRKAERRLKRLTREAARKKRGSNREREAYRCLARLNQHVANQRRDYAHKISRNLVLRYGLIAFEDLRVGNMVRNQRISKSILDAGWAQLVRYTTYKAEDAGRRVVLVDPRYTSQECSRCGKITPKKLSIRIHRCSSCGLVLDRDINAAINILARAVPAQTREVAISDEAHTTYAESSV